LFVETPGPFNPPASSSDVDFRAIDLTLRPAPGYASAVLRPREKEKCHASVRAMNAWNYPNRVKIPRFLSSRDAKAADVSGVSRRIPKRNHFYKTLKAPLAACPPAYANAMP